MQEWFNSAALLNLMITNWLLFPTQGILHSVLYLQLFARNEMS